MILVRLQRSFAERRAEWVLSGISTGWGVILLQPGETFNRPFYGPMAAMAPENVWGWAMFLVGSLRLVALYINGARTETPRARQIGCMFSMFIWALITAGTLSVEWRTPAIMTYGGLFVLEALSFKAAGDDASRALRRTRRVART